MKYKIIYVFSLMVFVPAFADSITAGVVDTSSSYAPIPNLTASSKLAKDVVPPAMQGAAADGRIDKKSNEPSPAEKPIVDLPKKTAHKNKPPVPTVTTPSVVMGNIRTYPYTGEIIPVIARQGFSTFIVLNPQEQILSAVGGDIRGWGLEANRGSWMIALKPRRHARPSNMAVVTNRHQYIFSLNYLEEADPRISDWQIVIDTSAEQDQMKNEEVSDNSSPSIAIREEQRKKILSDITKAKLAVARKMQNWKYSMEVYPKDANIVPTEVYDDGRFTYFKFPGNREFPSIYRVSPDKSESMAQQHITDEDYVVVNEVAGRWVLRLDDEVVSIWNDKYDRDGISARSGTVSSEVIREVGVQSQGGK